MKSAPGVPLDLKQLDSIALVSLCADNLEDTGLWTEFLRRFTTKLKFFIRGTLRQSMGSAAHLVGSTQYLETTQEGDLFQGTVLRLVENNCAALKRFSGNTEEELMAYFAIIARSTVRDHFRRKRAQKRGPWPAPVTPEEFDQAEPRGSTHWDSENLVERQILAKEVEQASLDAIRDHSGDPARDRLIFQLYFKDGLSTGQIAACRGVGLSKTGIEKTLNRIKDRVRTAVGAARVMEVEAP